MQTRPGFISSIAALALMGTVASATARPAQPEPPDAEPTPDAPVSRQVRRYQQRTGRIDYMAPRNIPKPPMNGKRECERRMRQATAGASK